MTQSGGVDCVSSYWSQCESMRATEPVDEESAPAQRWQPGLKCDFETGCGWNSREEEKRMRVGMK